MGWGWLLACVGKELEAAAELDRKSCAFPCACSVCLLLVVWLHGCPAGQGVEWFGQGADPAEGCGGQGHAYARGLTLRLILLLLSPHTGIINGGVVSALFDCHGNWTAAIALMDKAALPKPPLTLTYEMLVGG